MNKECVIIIPSCDNYSDAWDPFFHFFFKYWPDCPFPVCLITETKVFPDKRVTTINLKKDYGWANNVSKVLNQLAANYFIYFLEDVFLEKKVDTARILHLLEVMKRDKASCIRLYPSPGPDAPYEKEPQLGVIAADAKYRVSTMTAIWDKAAFLRVLRPGENAWQMEFEGTKRSATMGELFLSVYEDDPAVDIFDGTAIKKGRWQYDYVEFCKREGFIVDTSKRKSETKNEYLKRRFLHLPGINLVYRAARKLKLCK